MSARERPAFDREAKLSEREQQQIARYLSDPTYFPVEFRTWLKNYIEGAGITLTASQIKGYNPALTGLPAGILLEVVKPGEAPSDTLACDGSALSRKDYRALFGVVGVEHGAGDGSTTFNLPNRPGRVITTGRQA